MVDDARVLIVDDDVVINIITSILKRDKYLTDSCYSGEEALQKVRKNVYELVLLDVNLGRGLDGYETCKQLRDSNPDLPVILVTASQDDESVNKGFEAGSADYIKKPVSRYGQKHNGRRVKIIMSISNCFERRRYGYLNETKVEINI
jgi:DNA-binding response OmpR family regulator